MAPSVVVRARGCAAWVPGAAHAALEDHALRDPCTHLPCCDAAVSWELLTSDAGWAKRGFAAGVILSTGRIVMTGGTSQADVWVSDDGGATWTELVATAPWLGRDSHATVVLSDDTIVMAGGKNDVDGWFNDVWVGSDGGAVWSLATDTAAWSPRHGHAMVATRDDVVVLAGGTFTDHGVWRSADRGVTWARVSSTIHFDPIRNFPLVELSTGMLVAVAAQVWASVDTGATWTLQAPAVPWSGLGLFMCTRVAGDVLVITGGKAASGTRVNDVWASSDFGATWAKQEVTGPQWSGRSSHIALASHDGGLVVFSGRGAEKDVWRTDTRNATWHAHGCMDRLPAVCGATSGSVEVSVTTSSAVQVKPGTSGNASVLFVPVAATITLVNRFAGASAGAGGTMGTTLTADGLTWSALNTLAFAVDFSQPVSGLRAADFDISSRGTEVARVLAGTAASYWLNVTVTPEQGCLCQPGDGDCTFLSAAHNATHASAACAPHELASVDTGAVEASVAGLLAAAGIGRAWYTCAYGDCSLLGPCPASCTRVEGQDASFPRVRCGVRAMQWRWLVVVVSQPSSQYPCPRLLHPRWHAPSVPAGGGCSPPAHHGGDPDGSLPRHAGRRQCSRRCDRVAPLLQLPRNHCVSTRRPAALGGHRVRGARARAGCLWGKPHLEPGLGSPCSPFRCA